MDTDKARDKLEQIKDRYQLGGNLEKVKVSSFYTDFIFFLRNKCWQRQELHHVDREFPIFRITVITVHCK